MRVAIIGAGAAGLASARHIIANGYDCEVLEMASELGGTWVYSDDVGLDKYGFPVYTAMYKGLRTNLPKEIMGFPDFPMPQQDKSFLGHDEVLHFLNLYADHFKLKTHIKFNRLVMRVRPLEDNKWLISSIHKPTKNKFEDVYDVVMVCNGHYNEPIIPKFKGEEKFHGPIIHSHQYRTPERFAGQNVLIIGSGPSGMDLTLQISKIASKVIMSHHLKNPISTEYPLNVEFKPDVKEILNEEIEFIDGTIRKIDSIFCCTGYKYNFPFLEESCGITVTENHIEPLYKHMIHIEKPTMCFIGIPFKVCAFQMFDLQARFYVSYLNGSMKLPTVEEMYEDTMADIKNRWSKGYTRKQAHLMGPDQGLYYTQLAEACKTKSIPPVIVRLRDESVKGWHYNLMNFRENRYRIIDDETFIQLE